MRKNYRITEGVFYITNVCNLTCKSCMTYNDRIFKGHFNWDDHKEDYEKWSTLLSMDRITILGGEPFANPDLINWVKNIKRLWPECQDISVCTNGTYISNNAELVNEIISHGVWLDVCVHDPEMYNKIQKDFENSLGDLDYDKIRSSNHDIGFHGFDVEDYYGDGLICKISKQWNFSSNSTKEVINGLTFMHKSDPQIAHKNCAAKYCHYFVKGKLHKCFLTGISKELISQIAIDDDSKNLLNSYRGCSPWDAENNLDTFIENIGQYVPQCSLCPNQKESFPIWPLSTVKNKI